MEFINKLVNILERFRYIENRSQMMLAVLAALTLFGVMNCFLGYRLLRFWMMLGGVAAGAVLGYFIVDSLENANQNYYIFGIAGCGIICGVIAFFIYRVGIFAIGAVIGAVGSFYLLHPMAYSTLFVCLLIGTGLGMLTLKFSREVIIVCTSILGGALTGLGGARLANFPDFPHGISMSAATMIIGMIVQFLINKTDTVSERNRKNMKHKK